jgi:hypothetical protein
VAAQRRPGKRKKGKGLRGAFKGRGIPEPVVEQGKRQLEDFIDEGKKATQARGQAIRYAEQTGGEIGKVQFADGVLRYVVFKERVPKACFPVLDAEGNLSEAISDAMAEHDLDRIGIKPPDEWKRHVPRPRRRKKALDADAENVAFPPAVSEAQ